MPDWTGQTVVIIGSGPSLNERDCATVEKSGLTTVAVNTSWQMARFCHAIYAGDLAWWRHYGCDIDIEAERYTFSQNAAQVFGIHHHKSKLGAGYNSGVLAVEMAVHFGASRILLLGFDCTVSGGTHWHGDHTKTQNPNESKCERWKGYFLRLADTYQDVDIVNCSRRTALDVFPCMTLEQALA